MLRDPVCGMQIDPNKAVKLKKGSQTIYFCSQHCKKVFLGKKELIKHGGHEHHGRDGHSMHHAHMVGDFKRRFWISLIATIPVLLLSPFIQSLLKFSLRFPGDKFILFGISTFIYFYGGWPFLKGIFDEIRNRLPGMMTLIGLAISVAYIYSSLVVFGLRGEVFFWELVTLIDIMLLGHWIEMNSVMGASRALEELAKLMPLEAHRIYEDGTIKEVKLEDLQKGDKVLVRPAEKIPADGKVIGGESEVNEALITGESRPVTKKNGEAVIGGSVNGTGSLTIEVTKTGKDSYLSQVIELVSSASESKSRAQDLANRAAFWLTIIAIASGTITLISWILFGKEFVFALERMVTVMVVTCPHALGLAIPLVIAVITALSAKNGLLIRNRTAFENARNLQTIVFDKTGTLTKGEFGVTDIISLGDWSKDELLRKVASIEINSEHSIARGIVKEAKLKKMVLYKIEKFASLPGKGARGELNGEVVFVGGRGISQELKINSDEAQKKMDEIASQGKTTVLVASKGKIQGIVGLADIIRDESKEAVSRLKTMGLEIAMITGDNDATARYVADQLGLDKFFSEVLPDKKSEKIRELKKHGKRVAMVGDGLNDAPALAEADVGIAIGAGTDVAIEAADVVLVHNDPRNVVDVIFLSRITQRKMIQNLAWATGYNIFAIPLAAGVLYNQGIILPPALGALIMSLSTIIVAINARLISYK
jgi:Cu2+-exporting ATPase